MDTMSRRSLPAPTAPGADPLAQARRLPALQRRTAALETAWERLDGLTGPGLSVAALALSVGFCGYAWALWRNYSDALARKTFRFSLIHLSLLFAALLIDHYL